MGWVYKFRTAGRVRAGSRWTISKLALPPVQQAQRIPTGENPQKLDHQICRFDLRIEPLKIFDLDHARHAASARQGTSSLDENTPLSSAYRAITCDAGRRAVPYLYYLHQMRLLDMALMAFIAISLAFPVFIWMRPRTGRTC